MKTVVEILDANMIAVKDPHYGDIKIHREKLIIGLNDTFFFVQVKTWTRKIEITINEFLQLSRWLGVTLS